MTAHTCTRHEPGTAACYRKHGCRCDQCLAAIRLERKRQKHARATGRRSRVPAGPIRAHVQRLVDGGMGRAEIARRADVEIVTISRLLRGDLATMRRDRAGRIASVAPAPVEGQLVGLVDATGAIRRMRALAAIGWSHAEVMRRAGRRPADAFKMCQTGRCYASTRAALARVYDELWCQRPAWSASTSKVIHRAAREGWPPPMAWDDDTIDDPAARPCGVLPPAMTRTRAERERRIESVRDLLDVGEDPERIAARLGVDVRALTRMLRRHAPELAKHFNAAERRAAA